MTASRLPASGCQRIRIVSASMFSASNSGWFSTETASGAYRRV